jgi:hypothetical protein
MRHPGQEEFLEVLAGKAAAEEAERVWGHVAACPVCEERYRALRSLRDDLDGVLAEEGLDVRTSSIVRIRGFLQQGIGALGEYLGGNAGSPLAPAPPMPGGIGDPEDGRDGRAPADRAWAGGRSGEARSLLGELFRMDSRTAERREIALERGGREVLRVVIDAGRREVAVLLRDGMKDVRVFLVPEMRSLRRAESKPVDGADYHLVLFRDVEPGRFDLVLEVP